LHQGGLAAAQLALEANQVAGLQQAAQLHAQPARLFRAIAEHFEGAGAQNGHMEIISAPPRKCR